MYMVYKMKAKELDSRFLRALKAMFKDKEIEIVVCEAAQRVVSQFSFEAVWAMLFLCEHSEQRGRRTMA
jgi:hypothetical protein